MRGQRTGSWAWAPSSLREFLVPVSGPRAGKDVLRSLFLHMEGSDGVGLLTQIRARLTFALAVAV